MQWEQGQGSKGRKLGYNGDLQIRRYRDRDMGRGMIHRGQNSGTESMENGAEWELEEVDLELVQGSGGDMVLQS